eukprot:scaffold211765_cov30-Tisochrysis_lutea.AAC.2
MGSRRFTRSWSSRDALDVGLCCCHGLAEAMSKSAPCFFVHVIGVARLLLSRAVLPLGGGGVAC